MTGLERRTAIIDKLKKSQTPVPGKDLALQFHVSRQVIVQDMALIRAMGYDIISTNRGYLVHAPASAGRVMKVSHSDEQLEDELCTIVDFGGKIINVFINHRAYGRIEAPLNIDSRRKVAEFMEDIRSGKSRPLKNITSNYHYHRIEADSEETLDLIETALREKNYLVEN